MDRIPLLREKASGVVRTELGPLHVYVAALMATATVIAVALIVTGEPVGNPWIVLLLGIAAAVAERGSVQFTATTELSIAPVLMLFAAVLFGPLAGGIVGAASELGDGELLHRGSPGRSPRLKWLTYTSTRFMVGAATGGVAMFVLSASSG